MTDLQVVSSEPKPLMWRGREVEFRDFPMGVSTESKKIAADGDGEGALLHVLAHSLYDKETGQRVFRSLAQIRTDVTHRETYKITSLAWLCNQWNAPDEADITPELKKKIDEASGPK